MKLKFCGLCRMEDLEALRETPVDYLGFVFAESPRQVTPEMVLAFRKKYRGEGKFVGVFKDQPLEEVVAIAKNAGLDVIQLHGSETQEYLELLRERTGLELWKALGATPENLATAGTWPVEALIIDHPSGGGGGQTLDWSMVNQYKESFGRPFFLAGGLCLENITEAMTLVEPSGLDLSSGLETDGRKDPLKMREIVRKVKGND